MATPRSLEARLDRLRELEDVPVTDAWKNEIQKMLASPRGVLAGKAAKLVGDRGCTALLPDVVRIFDRFMENPVKTDPGCLAKCGAIEALTTLRYEPADPFLAGIRHVQKEPAWGPPVDTADKLRGLCAYALYAAGHPQLYVHLVDLLQDPEPVARIAAVQVLGNMDSEVSELLLRMKALQGDEELEVLGECLSALMRMAPQASLAFAAEFVARGGDLATEAGFALGESRLPEACDLLVRARADDLGPSRDSLLLPIALTRQDAAFEYLLEVVAHEHPVAAEAAVKALPVLTSDPDRTERVARAVRARNQPRLEKVLRAEFPRL